MTDKDFMTDETVPEAPDDIATESPTDAIPPLPGFDPATYLALNADVAAQIGLVDAASHYRDHGLAELRAVLPAGQGLDHPASRALSPAARARWQDALRDADVPLADLVADHPRANWLQTGFTLAGYLRECADVAMVVDDPLEAAFHFLEFGLEEGRMGWPKTWDADFVAARYGIAADPEVDTIRTVLARG